MKGPQRKSLEFEGGLDHSTMDRGTLSIAETSQRLGLSRKAVRTAITTGEIQAVKIGRRWLVLRAPLEDMLRSGSAAAKKPRDP